MMIDTKLAARRSDARDCAVYLIEVTTASDWLRYVEVTHFVRVGRMVAKSRGDPCHVIHLSTHGKVLITVASW